MIVRWHSNRLFTIFFCEIKEKKSFRSHIQCAATNATYITCDAIERGVPRGLHIDIFRRHFLFSFFVFLFPLPFYSDTIRYVHVHIACVAIMYHFIYLFFVVRCRFSFHFFFLSSSSVSPPSSSNYCVEYLIIIIMVIAGTQKLFGCHNRPYNLYYIKCNGKAFFSSSLLRSVDPLCVRACVLKCILQFHFDQAINARTKNDTKINRSNTRHTHTRTR